METVLICKYFIRYSNFAHKLNLQLWVETQLVILETWEKTSRTILPAIISKISNISTLIEYGQ